MAGHVPVRAGQRPGRGGGRDRARGDRLRRRDEVIGYTDNRASQAEYVVVAEQHLTAKPAGVPWAATLAELAGLIAAGQLEVPIAVTFPLSQVQDAYRRLASGHIRGKIVLSV